MKLKYYLRGLGIGIAVTALIMSLTKKEETLTDAEIMARASALGMVEEGVMADLMDEEESEEIIKEPISQEEPGSTEEVTEEMASQEETLPTNEEVSEETSEENGEAAKENTVGETDVKPEENNTDVGTAENNGGNNVTVEGDASMEENVENYIVITVERGNGSDTVSRKLYEAGLVHSAADYDRYLISNGYDRKLSTGNHEIPAGADEETIARILCRMQ